MGQYDKLVKALRCKRDDCEGCDLAFFDKDEGWMCQYAAKDDDAADAIEALQAEIRESMQRCAECGDELAHQMPKRGEWIDESFGYNWYGKCSVCGEEYNIDSWYGSFHYCPNCGAKMEAQDADT